MMKLPFRQLAALAAAVLVYSPDAFAGETHIQIPDLHAVSFPLPGGPVSGLAVLSAGIVVCALGLCFGLWQYLQTRRLPVVVWSRLYHDLEPYLSWRAADGWGIGFPPAPNIST